MTMIELANKCEFKSIADMYKAHNVSTIKVSHWINERKDDSKYISLQRDIYLKYKGLEQIEDIISYCESVGVISEQ